MEIKLQSLAVGYEDILVNDINIDFKIGQINVILGRNGEGKTTLLKTIAGLLPVKKGIIVPKINNEQIGYVNNYKPTMPHILVSEYLSYGNKNDQIKDQNILATLNIPNLERKFISELSDGQFKKVAIYRQLLKNPKILFLDEPTSFLDIENKKELQETLIKTKANSVIIVVTHDIDFAKKIGDQFYLIKNRAISQIDKDSI